MVLNYNLSGLVKNTYFLSIMNYFIMVLYCIYVGQKNDRESLAVGCEMMRRRRIRRKWKIQNDVLMISIICIIYYLRGY